MKPKTKPNIHNRNFLSKSLTYDSHAVFKKPSQDFIFLDRDKVKENPPLISPQMMSSQISSLKRKTPYFSFIFFKKSKIIILLSFHNSFDIES